MRQQRKILLLHEAKRGTSPRRLSLRTDGCGFFTIGSCRDLLPVNSADSWKRLTEDIGRVCGLNEETGWCLVSLDCPLRVFHSVEEVFQVDGSTLRIAVRRQPSTNTLNAKRGKKQEVELRRAQAGLARVNDLLERMERTRTCGKGAISSSSSKPRNKSTETTTPLANEQSPITAIADCVGDGDFRMSSQFPSELRPLDGALQAKTKRQKSCRVVRQVSYRVASARAGHCRGAAPQAPSSVVVSGLFGHGVYVLWTPVSLDSWDCNNGLKVLGYKVFLDGQMEAILEGPLTSHVVLYELEPGVEHEIFVKTRCEAVDSVASTSVKYRSDCPEKKNALPRRLVEALNELTNVEVPMQSAEVATAHYVDGDTDKESTMTSSSGIVADEGLEENIDMPSFSSSPARNLPAPSIADAPDSPQEIKLTQDVEALLVEWKPVELDSNGLNNGHRILGYKVYGNGKLLTRARGPKADKAYLLDNHIRGCSGPLVVTIKTQAIYLDSRPSEECFCSHAESQKILSVSRDSIYSSDADQSRHTSLSETGKADCFFRMNKDDSGIFEPVLSGNSPVGITTFTTSAVAKLSEMSIHRRLLMKMTGEIQRLPCVETAL
eukprot:m.307150 g.307150  ORF g.307150 m.307150 type:complete len:606 (+) comp41961_c0_seq1:1514-3331(+)